MQSIIEKKGQGGAHKDWGYLGFKFKLNLILKPSLKFYFGEGEREGGCV